MEMLKLIGVTLVLLLLLVGGLTIALTKKRKKRDEGDCKIPFYEESSHPSCGCGSGACGLPAEPYKKN